MPSVGASTQTPGIFPSVCPHLFHDAPLPPLSLPYYPFWGHLYLLPSSQLQLTRANWISGFTFTILPFPPPYSTLPLARCTAPKFRARFPGTKQEKNIRTIWEVNSGGEGGREKPGGPRWVALQFTQLKDCPCLLPLPLHLAFKGPGPDLCFLKRSSGLSSCTRLSGRSAQGKNSDHDLGQAAHAAAADVANTVVRCGLRVRISGVPRLRARGADWLSRRLRGGGRRRVAGRRLYRSRRVS